MTTTHAPPFRASRYTMGAIVLHWTIALLILAQIAGGYAMVEFLRTGSALQYDVFQLHKSLGVAVLILTVARILWRLFNPPPPEPASVNRMERTVSHIVHMAFYALLLLIPLSGWFLITVSPIQIETVLFFTDWLPWPHIPGFAALPENARESLAHLTEYVHAWLAYGAGVLVLLHVAGALKHHLADGDFITRMSPFAPGEGARRSFGATTTTVVPLVLFALVVGAAALNRYGGDAELAQTPAPSPAVETAVSEAPAQPVPTTPEAASAPESVSAPDAASAPQANANAPALSPPPRWTVVPDASRLTYQLVYNGAEVEGAFETFDAAIVFSPDNLEASSIAVTIDTSSATIDSSEISRSNLAGSDGFDNRNQGTARFEADTIRADGDGYVADGVLTIRGVSVPQQLAFTVDIQDVRATATGTLTLQRLDYGIGEDADTSGSTISLGVTVNVAIEATRAAPAPAAIETPALPEAGTAQPPLAEHQPLWTVFPEESTLAYAFRYQDDTVSGEIGAFDAEIRFDPDNLATSSIVASMDLDSVTAEGGGLGASEVKGSDGLNVRAHPTATFRSYTIAAGEDGGYIARGTLSAGGVAQEIDLPFTLAQEGGRTVATANVALDRAAFGFAEGAGLGDDIGATIEIDITIVASPPGAGLDTNE